MPMGVLDPGSAHARPSARPPIDTSGNFSAYLSAEVKSEVSEPYDNPPVILATVTVRKKNRHKHRKISAIVDGGPSGGSSVRRPGSEDPHRRLQKFQD